MAENDPKIVLVPHQRSHQFVRRDVQLREPAMVGRSVARAKILPSNLIFDCRVLSRSHAVIWFDSGKVGKLFCIVEFKPFLLFKKVLLK